MTGISVFRFKSSGFDTVLYLKNADYVELSATDRGIGEVKYSTGSKGRGMRSYKATIISLAVSIMCGFIHVYAYYLSNTPGHFFAIVDDVYALSSCIFVSSVVLMYGIVIDLKNNRRRQQTAHVNEIYSSMISAMHHILNNFFNGMELVRMEAKGCKDFDPKIISLYDESVQEAVGKINSLSELEEISDDAIWEKIMPGMGSPLKK